MEWPVAKMRFVYLWKKKELALALALGYTMAVCTFRLAPDHFSIQSSSDALEFDERDAAAALVHFAPSPAVRGRILCWVVTSPRTKNRANLVKQTWGKRCDKLIFMSSEKDRSLPSVRLPIGEESRDQLWTKAKMTFKYLYSRHLNDFDWFFKADDDTYAIVENLRSFLAPLNSSRPYFLGHQFGEGDDTFLSGGAGYVLSRETMRRLVEKGLKENACPSHRKGEEDDVTITQCLLKLGAIVPSTSDHRGHHRFLSCNVEQFYEGQVGPVQCRPGNKELNCLSNEPITFHYVTDMQMLVYEYLLYRAKVNR